MNNIILNISYIENLTKSIKSFIVDKNRDCFVESQESFLNEIGLLSTRRNKLELNNNKIDNKKSKYEISKIIIKMSMLSDKYKSEFIEYFNYYKLGKAKIKKYLEYDLYALLDYYGFFDEDIDEIFWKIRNLPNSLDNREDLIKGKFGEYLTKIYNQITYPESFLEWTSEDVNSRSPYDIRLEHNEKNVFFIEVKTSTHKRFILSKSEWNCCLNHKDKYLINFWDLSNQEKPRLFEDTLFNFNNMKVIPIENKRSSWQQVEFNLKFENGTVLVNDVVSNFQERKLNGTFITKYNEALKKYQN